MGREALRSRLPHYNPRMPKMRLDLLLVKKGLAESRAKAQALVMAGQVRVAGQVEFKPASLADPSASLEIERGPRFVSRGGEKLDAALHSFEIEARGIVCADVGASTGGFTDCLLQHGAARVYAIDVGKGLLHWKLRNDPRLVVLEETNARLLQSLPEAVSLVTIDASFISLKVLLPVAKVWLAPLNLGIVALVKPQFEAGRKEVARGSGVIRDPAVHRQVLTDVLQFAESQGLWPRGLIKSPLLGPKGNAEFLAWFDLQAPSPGLSSMIESALAAPAKSSE